MKKLLAWSLFAVILMIGCPFVAVMFAGSAGMAVCFILFFGVNPLFCALCGLSAGKNIRKLWSLPLVTAGLFLMGTWLFFEMKEMAFLIYCVCYFVIGITAMAIGAVINKKNTPV